LKAARTFLSVIPLAVAICLLAASAASTRTAEAASQKPAEKAPEKTQEKAREKPAAKASPEVPAQIELLETRVRFETDGGSRKEVHARVKINDELGVRQFARLNFDFNRSFEKIEIPLVRITHPSGGTVDVLPSAITDTPNPAVVNAPAYQDVRIKSVRILGLEPGDTLEYRVITTTSHAPLAPDFWLDHSFDRTGVVSREVFELNFPAAREVHLMISPRTPATSNEKSGSGPDARTIYQWALSTPSTESSPTNETGDSGSDIVLTSYGSWQQFVTRVAKYFEVSTPQAPEIVAKATALVESAGLSVKSSSNPLAKIEALYYFASQKIRTVDLPLDAMGFRSRDPKEILASGYGTPQDKYILFAALCSDIVRLPRAALVSAKMPKASGGLARPSVFEHLLTEAGVLPNNWRWLDLNLEVAPYAMIPSQFRAKPALMIIPADRNQWHETPTESPFPAKQRVEVDAALSFEGKLNAKVRYTLRGDNELLLRVAFHRTPKENWKNVAQLLALSDGFRGQITNVTTSDPYETRDPFTVEYEITQPKFLSWSKKPLRMPALLPLLGLPDPPVNPTAGATPSPINLGTPLDVEVSATVHLPAGTTAQIPTGTSVERDFATYASQYSTKEGVLTASRHLNFILKKIPADRTADYDAFLQAVQNDESQVFTLDRAETTPPPAKKP